MSVAFTNLSLLAQDTITNEMIAIKAAVEIMKTFDQYEVVSLDKITSVSIEETVDDYEVDIYLSKVMIDIPPLGIVEADCIKKFYFTKIGVPTARCNGYFCSRGPRICRTPTGHELVSD